MLNTNNLTQKSMEAISTAQSIAVSYQNMNIEQQHILLALLQAEDGLIPQLIKKMGADASQLTRLTEQSAAGIPKVTGSGRDPERYMYLPMLIRHLQPLRKSKADEGRVYLGRASVHRTS